MQAKATLPRHNRPIAPAVFTGAALAFLSLILALGPLKTSLPWASDGASTDVPRIAYFEFAPTADTLWAADPAKPSTRTKLLTVPHGFDFGVTPALAPDAKRFVYTALPAQTKAPNPDTPAELWLFDSGAPSVIASNVDLRVKPVWSPDGSSVIFRRSDSSVFQLVSLNLATMTERTLISDDSALFPLAYAADGSFLLVQVQANASSLVALTSQGEQREAARLADGLTRDWALSPDMRWLAYLVMSFDGGMVASRAHVLDLMTGTTTAIGSDEADAFGPVWTPDGTLAIGWSGNGRGGAGLLLFKDGNETRLPGPLRGFDVPLAFRSDLNAFVVRSFDGSSATAPGLSQLVLVGLDGKRTQITDGDVTYLGSINR